MKMGAAGAAGGLGLLALSGGASADVGHLSISGDTITTDDGTVNDVRSAVSEAYVTYDGIDENVTKIRLTLDAYHGSAGWEEVILQEYEVSNQSSLGSSAGSLDGVSMGDASLLDATSWEAGDFEASTDGESNTTTVEFRLRLQLFASGTEVNPSAQESTTADFTVNNQEATSDTGGHGDGTLEGEDQDP